MKLLNRLIIFAVVLALFAGATMAEVTGPSTLVQGPDQRLQFFGSQRANATAGNITEVNMTSWSVTRTWAGFYGEVRGTIVLADQNNNTLYDWNNANPDGRVYAARVTNVDWTAIRCMNQSELDGREAKFTGTNETNRDGEYPIDRPNATFVKSTAPGVSMYANYSTFWVGDTQINGTFNSTGQNESSQCYSTVMHNSTGFVDLNQNAGNDMNRFRELLLSDGSNTIYTAILEDDYTGFDDETHDFQMIVGEDGHGTDTALTPYYFYVELG